MIRTLEGSKAIAESVVNCKPDVVACYPITPTTHVAEALDKAFVNGRIKKFIATESEFTSISAILGATAAGSRAFSTTSSQGLLLMHEVLFTAAGMRLPLVMFVGNRAVSAPLNIWNDEQDSVSQRDCGWIQLYCESIQEAVDSIPQAYKIAEKTLLPVMVCGDGHYLTHVVGQVDIPSEKETSDFLPEFKPKLKLDPQNPVSLGVYANPSCYQEFRQDLDNDLRASREVIKRVGAEWNEKFKRAYGLIDAFQTKDADRILVSMGSITPSMRAVANELRAKGEKVGVLRVRSFRPFPSKEVRDELEDKTIGVFEKALSLGSAAPLYAEVAEALRDTNAIISSFVGGLGGREVTRGDIRYMFDRLKGGNEVKEFVSVRK